MPWFTGALFHRLTCLVAIRSPVCTVGHFTGRPVFRSRSAGSCSISWPPALPRSLCPHHMPARAANAVGHHPICPTPARATRAGVPPLRFCSCNQLKSSGCTGVPVTRATRSVKVRRRILAAGFRNQIPNALPPPMHANIGWSIDAA